MHLPVYVVHLQGSDISGVEVQHWDLWVPKRKETPSKSLEAKSETASLAFSENSLDSWLITSPVLTGATFVPICWGLRGTGG